MTQKRTVPMWLHLDCFSGISGDMTLGALCDLGVPLAYLRDELAKLKVDGYTLQSRRKMVGVLDAVKVDVILSEDEEHHIHTHHHAHTHEHSHSDGVSHSHPHTHVHSHAHSHAFLHGEAHDHHRMDRNSDGHEHSGHLHEHSHTHESGDLHKYKDNHDHSHQHRHEHGGHFHKHSHQDGHSHLHTHHHDEHGHSHSHSHNHEHHHGHDHRSYRDICELIDASELAEGVKKRAHAIFARLAEAEAEVHGMSPQDVHFHEVGAIDSIVDIVGVAIGLDYLHVRYLTCAPIPLGRGFVTCQHGRIPIPAPATLELLRGVPIRESGLATELVTPTGAAIVAALVDEFVDVPHFSLHSVGYGAGTRKLPDRPNLLRVMLGAQEVHTSSEGELLQLEVNLDDLSPELLAYTMECLLEVGVNDVWTAPIQMKKGRAGQLLGVLCARRKLGEVESILFRQTSTLGFRYSSVQRSILEREIRLLETSFGTIGMKVGQRKGVAYTVAPEFEDCRRAAQEHNVPLKAVYAEALRLWERQK